MEKNKEVLDYWNDPNIESMYDKNLINLEIDLISSQIMSGSTILDAGCGEGEGTLDYSMIPRTTVYAADFSETRLEKAKERLKDRQNVKLLKIDFLDNFEFDTEFDVIVSQRFLINLMDFELQKDVILRLSKVLKKGGKLIMLEGSLDGVKQLNDFRKIYGLQPIPVKWHNKFFDDTMLEKYLSEIGLKLIHKDGIGEYFMLTRGIRATFDSSSSWNNLFNFNAAKKENRNMLKLHENLSRLKMWVVEKN